MPRYVLLPPRDFLSKRKSLPANALMNALLSPDSRAGKRTLRDSGLGVVRRIAKNGRALLDLPSKGEKAVLARLSQSGAKVVPEVFYRFADAPVEIREPLDGKGKTKVLVRSDDDSPVRGAWVRAFTDFGARAGCETFTNAAGEAVLEFPPGTNFEKIFVYPRAKYWSKVLGPVPIGKGHRIEVATIKDDHLDGFRRQFAKVVGSGGKGVVIGIVDGGVHSHPGLSIKAESAFLPKGSIKLTNRRARDHGTHVAGIIGCRSPLGRHGLAPNAEIRSYRVFGPDGLASGFDLANAIDAAAADGCHIINLSLSSDKDDRAVAEAIADATDQGCLVVAAAGNAGGRSVAFPARCEDSLAVAAMGTLSTFPSDAADSVHIGEVVGGEHFFANFSNEGSEVRHIAPGVAVISNAFEGFCAKSGTSMAAPVISAWAARALSERPSLLAEAGTRKRVEKLRKLLSQKSVRFGFGLCKEGHGLPR